MTIDQQSTQHLDRLLSPVRLNGLELRNRVIKAATFEGMTPNGIPSARLVDFHRAIAQGGTALTTLAYCAPEPDGRLHTNQLYISEEIRADLEQLTIEVHRVGGKISAQLAHCGNFTKNNRLQKRRPLGPTPGINLYGLPSGIPFAGSMSKEDIDAAVEAFSRSARLLKSFGFDAIEIHLGHGYLLSQFISPRTNRRTDEYGGSLTNRLRFAIRTIEAVRNAVGTGFPLLAKIGMTDGVKGGHVLEDAIKCAEELETQGAIDALVLSGGTSSMNPMLMFRGRSLMKSLIKQEKNPVARLGMQVIRGYFEKDYPYYDLYFLESARRIRNAVSLPLVYVGGAAKTASLEKVMAEGFDFVQLGRTLIKDPALVRNLTSQRFDYVNGCSHCNECAALIEHPGGIRCVENEPADLAEIA